MTQVGIPEDKYELYAEFGVAAEMAQTIEVDAGNVLLSFLYLILARGLISSKQFKKFRGVDRDVNSKTFGKLLKYVKSWVTLDNDLLEIIDDALDRRNYLIHKFFRSHNFGIHSETGRQEMIAELKQIQEKLNSGHTVLCSLCECIDHFVGRDRMNPELLKRFETEGKRLGLFPE